MAIFLLIVFLSCAAFCAGGSPALRRIGLCIAAGTIPLPWLLSPESSITRGVLAIVAIWGCARIIDLVSDSRPWSAGRRLWHVFGLLDTRQTKREKPKLDKQALGKALAYGLLTALGLVLVRVFAPHVDGIAYWAIRWIGGALFFYSLADTVEGLVRTGYRGCGIVAPRQHRVPIASRSIQEFWGERWNRAVGSWLRQHCFLPLARRGYLRAGLAAAFLTSALFHAYFTWAALGEAMAVSMAVFFLVQGQLVILELALRVSHWTPILARAWTITAILASSPLFIEPLLRIIHCPPQS